MSSPANNLVDVLHATVERDPDRVIIQQRDGTAWADLTAATFLSQVTSTALGLVAAGIQPGDRVGLLSKTRYEWTLLDFAIWSAGGVTVPLYETSSSDQIAWILKDSGAKACILETASHARRLASVADQLPELRSTWVIEGATPDTPDVGALQQASSGGDPAQLVQRRADVHPDSLATIIYTSGTTGRPKGCELTHGNFLAECSSALEMLPELFARDDASTLLFLPLAHVFGRMVQVACIMSGTRLGHSDPGRLVKDLAATQPTFVLAVPQVFEKIYETARRKATNEGKGKVFGAAANTAIAFSQAQDARRTPMLLRARHALFERLVYGKIRAAFGGRVDWAISGGAPLGARLGHFFRGIGVTVLEGYGLTETTAAATVNPPKAVRIGTVGRPLPGVEVRTSDSGEVLIKGAIVLRGYWHDEKATREVLDEEGWLHTGDLGTVDNDGYLTITGRSKEILVTSGGKNVAPAALEDAVRAHPLVAQCMVVGDARPYIAALITLDPESLDSWQKSRKRSPEHNAEAEAETDVALQSAAEDPEVLAEMQGAVDAANSRVSGAESIRKFKVLPTSFTEAEGHLTPTLKLRRSQVLTQFAADVDGLYPSHH